MTSSDACPCGSGETYALCCGRFHSGSASAPTAEALMRSRYSAFAIGDADYLLATWHPSTRPGSLEFDPDVDWRRLQIRATTGGEVGDESGTVAFVAHFWHAGRRDYGRQQENSTFRCESGRWLYLDAAP